MTERGFLALHWLKVRNWPDRVPLFGVSPAPRQLPSNPNGSTTTGSVSQAEAGRPHYGEPHRRCCTLQMNLTEVLCHKLSQCAPCLKVSQRESGFWRPEISRPRHSGQRRQHRCRSQKVEGIRPIPFRRSVRTHWNSTCRDYLDAISNRV